MSVAIDIQDQKLWNAYKTFSDDEGKGGELDDLFDNEDDEDADGAADADNEDDDDGPAAPSPSDDDEDEDDDTASADEDEEGDDEPKLPGKKPGSSDEEPEDGEDEKASVEKDDEAQDTAEGDPDGQGGTEDLGEMDVPDFDQLLAEKISEDALSAGMDADYIIYTRDFDVIAPLAIDNSEKAVKDGRWNDKWVTELEDETRGMTGVMQKDIQRMMAARSQVIRVPGYKSGRLHSAGLHRVLAGDDRVFRRMHENKSNDVVVSLLNDNSGSMWGIKMKTAMTASYALSSTLERVGIKHEVLGFTTAYSNAAQKEADIEATRTGIEFSRVMPIYMPIFKGFDERITPEIKQRFAAAPHMGYQNANVDGESVEYALARILKRPEKRKVLIVLSDGQPAADGDMGQQIAHLKRTIATAARMGVETVGIGILSDAVRHFYPKHFVLNQVNQLPGLVMQELKRILTA
ncbi:VWA domain-containing protein [Methylobacterium sp. WL103]|uniref:cobaltochelatase CobT-related protein n=1 Tax=Methylobacterium sp. WL103 TaxID=2603891 RepID=UPI0011C7CBF5|nr:VWA domain-containing protein [Methylobacterium sp. WL103]TXN07946.1 VWA domain-containing protein [Methylobacterium sp. WL103]